MTALHRLVNDDHRARRLAAPALAGAGAWMTVTSVSTSPRVVEGTVMEFDGGVSVFGPVPYRTDDTIAVGDLVLLLVTSDGQPAAALKF